MTEELGESTRIEHLRRTSAGFSRENWVFDAVVGSRREAFIARRDPVGSVLRTDRRVETKVLTHLETTTVPVPRLRWTDLEGGRLGRPAMVMEFVQGRCEPFALNGTEPLESRVALAHTIYDVLAGIHMVDIEGLDLPDPGPAAARSALNHWIDELRAVQLEPEPEMEFVLTHLLDTAPPNDVTRLVHGDFKPGNVLLVSDQISAVLDWETAHLGDPHEDLGWVTNPLRQGEHRIATAWEPADLLARWSDRTGLPVDPVRLRWWQILANFKLAVIVLSGIRAFVEGRLDRIYQSPLFLYRTLLDQIGA